MELNNYEKLYNDLCHVIDSKQLITNPLQLFAYGTDASFYRLIPKLVVMTHSEEDIINVLNYTNKYKIPVTYRAAGTSLSGQAISDSVLIVATHRWKNYAIMHDGELITLEPGITGGKANQLLKPYGRKIGPDPASINSAMIGGIAANNASGMCCGTSQNSYKTITDVRIILYDGTILDTSDDKSIASFYEKHSNLVNTIKSIRDAIKKDKKLHLRIRNKFKIKNTTGYSINAFVDYENPIDIIKHLIIGSEGTLGFISNITYETVPDEKYKSCTLIMFENIKTACEAVVLLKKSPVSAVELLDRASLRSIENDPESPEYFKTLPSSTCALLVECQADEIRAMNQKQELIKDSIKDIPTLLPYWFTSNPKEYNFNWKARKGLLSTVGGLRKTGTSCIIEDVAVPLEHLADAVLALEALFKKYKYTDAVLFGHALDGNLHLTFSQYFGDPKEIVRYNQMMTELSEIIVDQFDGSLKAEHGTGRNMAPFVEKEWGEFAYSLMKRLKEAFDPYNLINPDVIINKNPFAHIENLKPIPAANEIIDKCMECGFCEQSCVAEGLTLSPRQRIAVAREIASLTESGEDPHRLEVFKREAKYFFDETCATDGLCALACPVKIDTGAFVKHERGIHHSKSSQKLAAKIGRKMGTITSYGKTVLNIVDTFHNVLGDRVMQGIADGIRVISEDTIPRWNKEMPKGIKSTHFTKTEESTNEKKVVYFPSCINRTMGLSKSNDNDDVQLTLKTEKLLKKAGYSIVYPKNITELCCGMSFTSKGFKEEGKRKRKELENALFEASSYGKYPVLFDMSPCFYTFQDGFNLPGLKVYDPIEFMTEHVIPNLNIVNKKEEVIVFPVCSVKKIFKENMLLELVEKCADKVTIVESNCCGFAGDRGFTYPELNKHGLRTLGGQVPENCKQGYSTSRTCEIGLSEHSNINFKSIFYLIDDVTEAKVPEIVG